MKKLLLAFLITFSACGQDNDHVEEKHNPHQPQVTGMYCQDVGGNITRCENNEVVCYKLLHSALQCKFMR